MTYELFAVAHRGHGTHALMRRLLADYGTTFPFKLGVRRTLLVARKATAHDDESEQAAWSTVLEH